MKDHVAWVLHPFDREITEYSKQQIEADLNLDAGECCTEAVVDSVPKPNTAARTAIQAQDVRFRKTCGIPIGRTQHCDHPSSAGNVAPRQAHVSVRPAGHRLDRAIKSNQLLDGRDRHTP